MVQATWDENENTWGNEATSWIFEYIVDVDQQIDFSHQISIVKELGFAISQQTDFSHQISVVRALNFAISQQIDFSHSVEREYVLPIGDAPEIEMQIDFSIEFEQSINFWDRVLGIEGDWNEQNAVVASWSGESSLAASWNEEEGL